MNRTTKTLSLEDWIVDAVQQIADKERRSFTKETEVLLAAAIEGLQAGLSGSECKK